MSRVKKKDSIIKYKVLYTMLIFFVYLFGRGIPLFRVDTSVYTTPMINAQTMLIQAISGDMNRMSLFALGISPYMIASIIVQVVGVYCNSQSKSKISPKKMNRVALVITFIFALLQAIIRANQLQFVQTSIPMIIVKSVTALEMITGVMLILWLCVRNKKYGIGGQSAIIYLNILSGIIANMNGHTVKQMVLPLAVSMFVLVVVLIMENAEKQIPVQRISIHNIYADKNYLAIKLNPIGIMPIMFSTGFFMLPQIITVGLGYIFHQNEIIIWLQENLVLTRPLGIIVFIVILYILTIGFSIVFINPKEITEQFLKSGDSIVNLHAGHDTKRYLSREIYKISFLSATVMSVCLGIPMFLQLYGELDSSLVMFPSSIMMLTGIWCNLYREIVTVKNIDAYEAFI